jgi:hypothetical protein
MRIGVIGSRTFQNRELMEYILHQHHITELVSGDCRDGADKLAKDYAYKFGIRYTGFPANWSKDGKRAGAIRNKKIVDYVGGLIAFWDGESPSSLITIEYARRIKMPIIIVDFNGLVRTENL